MSDLHLPLPRHLNDRIRRALKTNRIVHLVGPRQAGKTTLVRSLVGDNAYYTLDDDALRDALQADPWGHLQVLLSQRSAQEGPIVIDEVQRLPEVTLAIKRIVDDNPQPGQFLITGSADILRSGGALDSLAGRVTTLPLLPFSAAEADQRPPSALLAVDDWDPETAEPPWIGLAAVDRAEVVERVLRGGYPEIRLLDDVDRMDRHNSYLESVIERDFAELYRIRKPDQLRRLIDQLAARTAQELNVRDLCTTVGVRHETVEQWMDALERLGIVRRLGAWTSSPARREIKSPKLHFLDSGCAASLRNETSADLSLDGDPRRLGALLETWVYTEIVKLLPLQQRRWRAWHWRAPNREIDILLEGPGPRRILIEVKAAARVRPADARHLSWFMNEGPGAGARATGLILYMGDHVQRLGPRLFALPISIFWSGESTSLRGR